MCKCEWLAKEKSGRGTNLLVINLLKPTNACSLYLYVIFS